MSATPSPPAPATTPGAPGPKPKLDHITTSDAVRGEPLESPIEQAAKREYTMILLLHYEDPPDEADRPELKRANKATTEQLVRECGLSLHITAKQLLVRKTVSFNKRWPGYFSHLVSTDLARPLDGISVVLSGGIRFVFPDGTGTVEKPCWYRDWDQQVNEAMVRAHQLSLRV